jgi:hypothetical protein
MHQTGGSLETHTKALGAPVARKCGRGLNVYRVGSVSELELRGLCFGAFDGTIKSTYRQLEIERFMYVETRTLSRVRVGRSCNKRRALDRPTPQAKLLA